MCACTRASWLQPFRLLCWLANTTFQWPVVCNLACHARGLSLLAACKILARYLSRPKRGSLRRPRESSDLRHEGSWLGQWQQSGARLSRAAARQLGDVWRHDSGEYGCATTTCHRNFTAGKLPDTSTKNTGQGAHRQIIERCCSRIAINTQRANDLRIAVSHTLPPYSQRFVQNGRAHSSPDSLSLKKNTQSNENRALTIDQHSQGRPHAAVAAADARRRRRGAATAFARHFKPRCQREHGQNSNSHTYARQRRAQHSQQLRTAARTAQPPQRT